MNRLMLSHEDTAPLHTRYTVWKRVSGAYTNGWLHVMNLCTLATALQQAQMMTPRGYITTVGEKP